MDGMTDNLLAELMALRMDVYLGNLMASLMVGLTECSMESQTADQMDNLMEQP